MENLDDLENAKVSDSAYSNSCSNSQSRRSHSSKSTHSGSHSSGSSGYGGKPSTSGSSNNLGQPPKIEKEQKKKNPPLNDTLVAAVVVETEESLDPTQVFDAPKEKQLDEGHAERKFLTSCQLFNTYPHFRYFLQVLRHLLGFVTGPKLLSSKGIDRANAGENRGMHDVPTPSPLLAQSENDVENMEICSSELKSVKDEVVTCNIPLVCSSDGFSCVISMHDGVVMYTTSTLSSILGFPKDMWIGRSFIDFVHPRDRSTLTSQITSGLAIPKICNGLQEKVSSLSPPNLGSTMVCRIRRYRSLKNGFSVKDKVVGFLPFLLKLAFKNISDEEGKVTYLVIQATPFYSAFKTPNEIVLSPVPFVIRHAANGHIEYVEPESVPYLGYLPQDLVNKDALELYHPDDLYYLQTIYDAIVKEGGVPRSKFYRMKAHNGDYVKLETEWSSFINPWSKKLEFVIGKHHIIEGPTNPDVFQSPQSTKAVNVSDEEKKRIRQLRKNITRTMNEVLTKPAAIAKQQMSKRCQDLASFMETLMQEAPKTEEELRLEIQDPDNSYYERDSVMLGGISPHHDYYDSKSSTETPLSYNQINYNETLHRYFESHQPISYEDYNTVTGVNILGLKNYGPLINHCLSPMAQNSRDSGEMTCSSDSNGMVMGETKPKAILGTSQSVRLTECLLSKHNTEMEKELMKTHRVSRSSSKGGREKNSNETRQKKKEHLARCNASFHPTSAGHAITDQQPHGVKRPSKPQDSEAGANKQQCTSLRQSRRKQCNIPTDADAAQPSAITTTTVANNLASNSASNVNTFILGVGMPQTMPTMMAMPGIYPMYYMPAMLVPTTSANTNQATSQQFQETSTGHQFQPTTTSHQFQAPSTSNQFQEPRMMMYNQPMYAPSLMYSPLNHMQQSHSQMMAQYTNTLHPLGLTSSNYEEACKLGISLSPGKLGGIRRDKKKAESRHGTSTKTNQGSECDKSSNKALKRSTEGASDPQLPQKKNRPNKFRQGQSEETPDKTDGESSYSSFYSSFFKTESGSAEESVEAKNNKDKQTKNSFAARNYFEPYPVKKIEKRKIEPPWLEKVSVTSEFIYKYQIVTKSMDEVLAADKEKMKTMDQPSLVNEQLGQLYTDLQLEGVTSRLTLEEGITSSSSSGEETSTNGASTNNGPTVGRKHREYSKLVMIYEEDAPLPPPCEGEVAEENSSASNFE